MYCDLSFCVISFSSSIQFSVIFMFLLHFICFGIHILFSVFLSVFNFSHRTFAKDLRALARLVFVGGPMEIPPQNVWQGPFCKAPSRAPPPDDTPDAAPNQAPSKQPSRPRSNGPTLPPGSSPGSLSSFRSLLRRLSCPCQTYVRLAMHRPFKLLWKPLLHFAKAGQGGSPELHHALHWTRLGGRSVSLSGLRRAILVFLASLLDLPWAPYRHLEHL